MKVYDWMEITGGKMQAQVSFLCTIGFVTRDERAKQFRAYLDDASATNKFIPRSPLIGEYETEEEAVAALVVYRCLHGRDPETGELV